MAPEKPLDSVSALPALDIAGNAAISAAEDEAKATGGLVNRSSSSSEKEAAAVLTNGKALEAGGRAPSLDFRDGGYGWVVCACVFFTAAVTWGVNGVFGVYLSFYLANDYFPGATPLQFAFVGGLSLSCAMLVGPISNFASKRYGFRFSYIIGTIMLCAGQLLAAFAKTLWELALTQGVLFGLGLGFIMVSTTPILATWFGRKRALAVGISGGGSGAGGIVLAQITRYVIEAHSLKLAFIVNACICAGVLTPCIILMRRPPNQKPQHNITFQPYKLSLFKNYGYVAVVAWGVFMQLAYSIGLYSIPTYATQALGYTQTRAALLQTLFNVGQLVIRPICGLLLDRYGRINMASACTLFCGLTCFLIWNFSNSFAPLAIFAILQGGTSGTFWISNQVLIVEVTSMPELTSGLSMLWLCIVPSCTFAEAIAVALIDYSRNSLGKTGIEAFRISINYAGAMFFVAGLCLIFAKRKKQGEWALLKKV